MFLVCVVNAFHRRRMSHNNGIVGRGKVRIVDNPQWPECEFFEPGREFRCRLRHATVPYMDDAMLAVRSLALKFADEEFKSPYDLQMNTGITSFFWNARTFLRFAFNRHEKEGTEYVKYYRKVSMIGPRNSFRRNPISFTQLYYYSQTPFEFRARDGVKRYVKFRGIPEDRGQESGLVDAELLQTPEQCADQKVLPDETRNRNYLKNEYRERVKKQGARYHVQLQLREARDDDSPEIFSCMQQWDEQEHPWMDLATIEIDEVMEYRDSLMTSFEISQLPSSLAIIPADSIDDYNSLNYMRRQSIWAIRLRRFMTGLVGVPKDYPDDGPRNERAPWT